jgi:hypothetical protein
LTDAAGRVALLTGEGNGHDYLVSCELDGAVMRYNAGFGSYQGFAPPVSLDYAASSAGGDMPGGKAECAGQHGSDVALGQVAPEVARVVLEQDCTSVESQIADSTYIARIVHPTDWEIPANRPAPAVRAYDKNGTLLGQTGP